MAREFRLPDIGEGLTEAEIVRWLVAEGEYVEADQPVVEVETDKAVVEIPSPYAGVVVHHGGAEGETIKVGEILVVIGEEGETAPVADETPAVEPTETAAAAPIVGTLEEEAEVLVPTPSAPSTEAGTVKALPIVRKLAREHGIDLTTVRGTGPAGRITREDLESAIAAQTPASTPTPAAAPAEEVPAVEASPATEESPAPSPQNGDERRPLSRLRRTIAANMAKSWAEIPHVTTFDEVDATRLLEIRGALASRHDSKIPLEALVIKAVIPALKAYPEFNATLDGDDLIVHHDHHIGIAVDTPDGLMVAVIRDAGTKGVLELAAEVVRLGVGARARTLASGELTGQTFTVSNIGAVGGGHGTPIVPYGTTAILSVGRAQQKPVVEDGELLIVPLMPLSLSYDHRVVDGAVGRRFVAMVIENLEEPALFLAD